MILLGFAWFLFTLDAANSPAASTRSRWSLGGLWGSRLPAHRRELPDGPPDRRDGPQAGRSPATSSSRWRRCLRCCSPARTTLGCDDCPTNLLLVRRDADVATVLTGLAPSLPRPLRLRPRVGGAALAADAAHRAPAAHAGLRLLAAHLRARDRGPGGRRRRGPVAGLHRHPADALRLPRRPAAHPPRPARRRAAREPGGAARLARADRARPATPSAGAWSATSTTARSRGSSRSSSCSAGRGCARRGADDGLEAMLADAIDELDTSLSELRELARGIHPAVLTDQGLEPALQALASRAPVPVTVDADDRRAPARPGRERGLLRRLRGAGQRRQVRPGDRGRGGGAPRRTAASPSTSPTTASAAPTSRAARACAAWPTASRRSTARSRSRARPAPGRTCTPRSPVRPGVSGTRGRHCGRALAPRTCHSSSTGSRRLAPPGARVGRPRRGVVGVGEDPHVVAALPRGRRRPARRTSVRPTPRPRAGSSTPSS